MKLLCIFEKKCNVFEIALERKKNRTLRQTTVTRQMLSSLWVNEILWPGEDYAEAGGADPGPDHEGPVEDDVQPRLGRDLAHHAQAQRHRGDGLNHRFNMKYDITDVWSKFANLICVRHFLDWKRHKLIKSVLYLHKHSFRKDNLTNMFFFQYKVDFWVLNITKKSIVNSMVYT